MTTPTSKYPAKSHARRTAREYERLTAHPSPAAFYLPGEKQRLHPYSDQAQAFRQRRYFLYLTGAHDLPDAHVVYHPSRDHLVLYLPPVDDDDVMWSGMPLSPAEAQKRYDVDEVKYSTSLAEDIRALGGGARSVPSPDADAAADVDGGRVQVDVDPALQHALDEARAIKDAYELGLLREAARRTDQCHLAVMSSVPIQSNERHIHAEFVYHAIRQGSKNMAYDPICCAGPHASTLHWVRNDGDMHGQMIVLIDAGVEVDGYAADVTRCYPISGEWTPEARQVYDLVHKMQSETMARVRPGVAWEELHLLAHKILIAALLDWGVLKQTATPDEIFERGVSAAFYPHGLGHMLGLDTHDTAGQPNYADPDPKLRYLRLRRPLQAGMVVTVEPGCYFNDTLIDALGAREYVDANVLQRYLPVGGVRIEDDVLVTEQGHECYSKIPRDPDEVSRIVKEGLAKGRSHFHALV